MPRKPGQSLGEAADMALKKMEERIAQLDTRWKLFFMGSKEQRYPPEKETQELARDLRNLPLHHIFRARHQFMHANLSYRFHLLQRRWNRFMRILEERGFEAVLDAMGIHNPNLRYRARQTLKNRYSRPPQEEKPSTSPYDKVYEAYCKALEKTGASKKVDKHAFISKLKKQEEMLRKKYGKRPLKISIAIEGNKPKIKIKLK